MRTILLRSDTIRSGESTHDDLSGFVCYLNEGIMDMIQIGQATIGPACFWRHVLEWSSFGCKLCVQIIYVGNLNGGNIQRVNDVDGEIEI